MKSAAVIAFRSSYRDRSFSPGSYERETFALTSLETVTEALLEIMEVRGDRGVTPEGQGHCWPSLQAAVLGLCLLPADS